MSFEPDTFAVHHHGRGGHVRHESAVGTVELPIEMGEAGRFSVWLRGAELTTPHGTTRPLRADERATLHEQLCHWLDHSGRGHWVVER